jgi:hypothetical protein
MQRDVRLAHRHPPQRRRQPLAVVHPELAPATRGGAPPPAVASQRDAEADRSRRGDRRCQGRDNGPVSGLPSAPWWTVRRAANRKPSTYRCPFCGHLLSALSEHMLIAPEGDTRRRRHAHSECVLRARGQGRLRLHDEWLAEQPRPDRWWRRLLGAR